MTTDEALKYAAKELPEGWCIEVQSDREGISAALRSFDEGYNWHWPQNLNLPLAANILRAVAWAKEQAK